MRITQISESTEKLLNELLTMSFQGNSVADNVAYWLDFNQYVRAQDIFHHKYAHKFPEFADQISDLMTKIGVRPYRGALTENSDDYDTHAQAFQAIRDFMEKYRLKAIQVIEEAEMNGEVEVKIAIEEFLSQLIVYYKQVNIWEEKAIEITDNSRFDRYFDMNTII